MTSDSGAGRRTTYPARTGNGRGGPGGAGLGARLAAGAAATTPTGARAALPGWVLLPQRIFLGVTFTFAGLQKLADPRFFDARVPTSLQGQLALFRSSSPIRGLLGPVVAHAVLFGVLIALAEIAVGLATLLGLWARLAAAGGALLSLSFLLTVSWHTRPYYYGSDIVFLAAWLPLIWVGAAGVLSLDAALSRPRASAEAGRDRYGERRGPPIGAPNGSERRPGATGPDRRPIAAGPDRRPIAAAPDRRAVATGLLAAGVVVLAGADAALGRLLGGNRRAVPTGAAPPTGGSPSPAPASVPASPSGSGRPGTTIGGVSQLPVGGVLPFIEPGTGTPAYVVQPARGRFLAFSAICTHAGCTVQYQAGARQFQCPCHGSVFDAATGAVLSPPAPTSLRRIPVQVVGSSLVVSG